MPHLLKALCPYCHGISLLDPSPSSEYPFLSTSPRSTLSCSAAPSPTYPCTHCGKLLHLNDRYTLVEALGRRSFLALDWQHESPRPCVVQREFPPRSLGEPILRRLRSLPPDPHWPQVQGYFEQGGLGYLVQDYCPGQTLTQWMARVARDTGALRQALPAAEVARVVETLLFLLSGIHQQGLIHGDVKPANILIPSGNPETGLGALQKLCLVDWGNAQEPTSPLPPWLTRTDNLCPANAEYAAPEQLAGQPHFASDFYSVGVVGIQLLTGMTPFHWLDQGENWRLFCPSLSSDLEAELYTQAYTELCAQLDRLIDPNPDDRYTCTKRSFPVPTVPVQISREPAPWHLDCTIHCTLSGTSGHTAAVKALVSNRFNIVNSPKLTDLTLRHWLASAGDDRTLRLWNAETGELLSMVTVPDKPIQVLCRDPHSPYRLISGSADGLLRWWEIRTNSDHPLELIPLVNGDRHHQGSINALVLITSQIFASAGADKTIYLWQTVPLDPSGETEKTQPIASLTGHRLAIQALAVNPQDQHLASGSSDATVKIWDLNRHSLITTLKGHTAAVKTVAFSPDGQYLASAGNDRTIQLWETQTWTLKFTLSGHGWPITQLKFSNHQTLWSSSWDSTLKCWDLSRLIRGENPALAQPLAHLQEHTDAVTCFLFLDDRVLISGSADCTLKIFRLDRTS